jgi:phage-related protein
MADDLTEKQLREIEKAGEDLTRSLNKARMEIRKAREETNGWFDATKAVQSATEALNKATEKQTAINNLITKNKSSVLEFEKQNFDLSNKAGRLLAKDAEFQERIAAEHAIINSSVSSVSAEMKNQARLRAEDLAERRIAIVEEINGINSRVAGNFEIIDALNAQTQNLVAQSIVQTKLVKQEKDRRTQAQLLKGVYDNLFGPLLNDAKEFKNLASLGNALSKGGAAGYLAIIKASLDRWQELDKAAADFREKTGFIVTQTRQLDKAAREVSVQFASIGVNIGAVYATAQALVDQFQVIGLVTKEMISDTAQMAANIGIAITDAAKFRGLFTSISQSAGMTATQSMQAASALAEMGGVAPSAVIKDMAEASSETLSFLAKSPMALIKATVEARRLGTTVNSLSKSARGFLNYQDSITSELEASALIGKSLNFQEARAAAYAGDVVKSRELALKQLEKAGDFTKLNVYQQEALAKAAGMTVDEVIKQQNQQKMLAEFRAKATGKDKEMLDKYEAMQKKIAENEKAAKEDLVARGREMMQQQLRQAEMNKLTNALNAIWTDITDALLPIANTIMPVILVAARALGMVFKVISAVVRGFLSAFDGFGKIMRSSEEGGLKLEEVMASIGAVLTEKVIPIVEKLGEVFGFVLNAISMGLLGITRKFSEAFKPFKIIGTYFINISDKLSIFSRGLTGAFKSLTPILNSVAGIFKFIGNFVKNVLGPIGLVISAIQILWEWVSSIFEIFKRDDMNIFEKVIASLAALPVAIWNVMIQPIIDGVAWVLNKIWPGLGDGMLEGIKKIGSVLYEYTIQPFVDAYYTIKNILTGDEGIGTKILKSIKFAGEKMGELLAWPFRKMKELVTKFFSKGGDIINSILNGIQMAGKFVLNILMWPFKKISEFVYGIFTPSGGGSIISAIMNGISAAGSFILDILLFPFKFVVGMVSDLFSGNGELGTKIIEGIKSVASFIFDILSFPFKTVINFVSGLFGGSGDLGTKIIDGIKSIGSFIFDILTLPFKTVVNFVSALFSNAGEFATNIISGIKSIAGTLFDIFTVPFREVVNFVSGLFGGSGELGTKIMEGIKTTVEGIFDVFVKAFSSLIDVITWPFKQAFELISKIPFISKLFGGGNADATANVSGDAKAKAESSTTAPMEVKGLTELKDAIVKLTDAITRIGENRSTATTTATDAASGGVCCDAVVGKLDQLITLMAEGNIGVNIDGVKASKLLARASV